MGKFGQSEEAIQRTHDSKLVSEGTGAILVTDLHNNYRPIITVKPADLQSAPPSAFSSKFKWLAAVIKAITGQFTFLGGFLLFLVLFFFFS